MNTATEQPSPKQALIPWKDIKKAWPMFALPVAITLFFIFFISPTLDEGNKQREAARKTELAIPFSQRLNAITTELAAQKQKVFEDNFALGTQAYRGEATLDYQRDILALAKEDKASGCILLNRFGRDRTYLSPENQAFWQGYIRALQARIPEANFAATATEYGEDLCVETHWPTSS